MSKLDVATRLAGLAEFLPIFTDPGFSEGRWKPEPGDDVGEVKQMAWFQYSPEVQRFHEMVYELEWIVVFDYGKWMNSEEARQFFTNPATIANASIVQLERLLTAIMRSDRFIEGAIATAFEDGHIPAIVRRADVLLQEMAGH